MRADVVISRAELETLRQEAARYRWLREKGCANSKLSSQAVLPRGGLKATVAFRYWTTPEGLDATLDAELSGLAQG